MPEKCVYCGRFIGWDEFEKEEIGSDFTPDSHFGPEEYEFYHLECEKEFAKEKKQRELEQSIKRCTQLYMVDKARLLVLCNEGGLAASFFYWYSLANQYAELIIEKQNTLEKLRK